MNNKKARGLNGVVFLVFVVFLFAALWFTNQFDQREKEISWKKFQQLVQNDKIESVEVNQNKSVPTGRVEITLKGDDSSDNVRYLYVSDVNEIQDYLKEQNVDYTMPDIPQDSWAATTFLPVILTLVGVFLIFGLMNRQGGGANSKAMNFGKSRAKLSTDRDKKVTFAQVAGLEEEKEELEEIVDFLKSPKKYIQVGARIPKGVLLVGPPGTGKTLLAKAVAGEAGVPFFTISGSDFVEMFVGVGASRVRDLFEEAKKNAPCIIFIDEIDAVARRRGTGMGGGHDEREQTLNQLLVEMDGFGANEGVIMIAATNRPDILDPALMRPGRFDRQVIVGRPDIKGREEILKVHAKGKPLAPDVVLKTIAKSTAGFTGADLENLLNEAALLAARKDLKAITMTEVEEATIKVVVGAEKKSRVMSDAEKKLTAYHEAGHAIATYFCPTQDPVHQISIIPRGMAGGFTMSLPSEDKSYRSKKEMKEDIVVLLGGRVAEALIIGDISTGASNDIERATKLAFAMVAQYGMSDTLGPIAYSADDSNVFLGKELGHSKNYSESTAAKIDKEVSDIITTGYNKTEEILKNNIGRLHEVAKFLISNEKMSGDEFKKVMEGASAEELLTELNNDADEV